MKKYLIKIILIVITVISFSGCYTMLWSPDEQLPSESYNQPYYSEPYYGEYNYYYDYPWWVRDRHLYIAPTPIPTQSTGGSSAVNSVRNENGSRNTPTNDNRPVIRTETPSRNEHPNDSSNAASKTSSNNNSGDQTKASGSSRSNDGNNSARNNNGNRNSGNGRR